MKNSNLTKISLLCISSIFLISCDNEFSNPVGNSSSYSSGNAIFSNYVAIGDSLTAGYADAALYRSGQINSLPNILATQFKTVGGGDFIQPLLNNDNLGGLLFGGNANPKFPNRLVLDADPTLDVPKPEPIAGTATEEVFGSPLIGTTFNNMGVPGARSFHLSLAPAYGNPAGLQVIPPTANPYFVRFSKETGTTTIMDDAVVKQTPTFFTLWIGNNDILAYATDGADDTLDAITDTATFNAAYADIINKITTNAPNAKGVIANIPDVSTIPHFTAVAYNIITLKDDKDLSVPGATTAKEKELALNTGYAQYNGGLQQLVAASVLSQEEATRRTITFSVDKQNPLVIMDETLTDLTGFNAALINMRPATASDLIVLKAASLFSTGAGTATPLADKDVLIPTEIAAINTARLAFNATIKQAADANDNFAFYDAAKFMANLKANDYDYGTGSITSAFISGGGFSLDGVHPTARGYAIMANGIIDTINNSFGANIPKVDPGTYTTIFLK